DFFDPGYFAKASSDDPRGPAAGTAHVLRGGAWDGGPLHVRCSSRDYYGPGHRSYSVGFRVLAEFS
ncbi:MAG: formylglycine-generating enzyme family protein, partial [Planctomycetaceae bacterium]